MEGKAEKKKYAEREGEMESSTSVGRVPSSHSAEQRSTQACEETLKLGTEISEQNFQAEGKKDMS